MLVCKWVLALASLLAHLAVCQPLFPQYDLFSYSLPGGGGADAIAVADFNNDGLDDIVVVSSNSSQAAVMFSDKGVFSEVGSTFEIPTGVGPIIAAVAGDLDSDHQVDTVLCWRTKCVVVFGDKRQRLISVEAFRVQIIQRTVIVSGKEVITAFCSYSNFTCSKNDLCYRALMSAQLPVKGYRYLRRVLSGDDGHTLECDRATLSSLSSDTTSFQFWKGHQLSIDAKNRIFADSVPITSTEGRERRLFFGPKSNHEPLVGWMESGQNSGFVCLWARKKSICFFVDNGPFDVQVGSFSKKSAQEIICLTKDDTISVLKTKC